MEKIDTHAHQAGRPELLTLAEVADLLRVGRKTLHHACCGSHPNGSIPLRAAKVAGKVMFLAKDVDAYILSLFPASAAPGGGTKTERTPRPRRGRPRLGRGGVQ